MVKDNYLFSDKKWRSDVLNVQSSSYLFLKKKGWIFVIFRKLITRASNVVVAIEADNMNEANRIFNEWCKKDNNMDRLNSTLSEKEVDSERYVSAFNNWEELNRSSVKCSDFIIEKPDEPRYDLYFFINKERKYYYQGITMRRVAQELDYYDRTYKLTPASIMSHADDINYPTDNTIMIFEAVKRSED